MDRVPGRKDGPHELWPNVPSIREPITDPLPMLVTFRDPADPTTIEEVKPDALDVAFGPGVKLKRIIVQRSDDELTARIGERLRWLRQYYDKQFSGDQFQSLENKHKGLSAFMSAGSFSAGLGLSPNEKGR